MQPRQVEAEQGWRWIVSAYDIFKQDPWTWIGFTAFYLGVLYCAGKIPQVGDVVAGLLSPLLLGGIAAVAADADEGRPLRFARLFTGFQDHAAPLLIIGAASLLAVGCAAAILVAMILAFGLGELLGVALPFAIAPWMLLPGALVSLLLAAAAGMAVWFAPALVTLRGTGVGSALSLSFDACRRNVGPLLVYSLAVVGLSLVCVLSLFLGALVFAPVLLISTYTAYKDVFPP